MTIHIIVKSSQADTVCQKIVSTLWDLALHFNSEFKIVLEYNGKIQRYKIPAGGIKEWIKSDK